MDSLEPAKINMIVGPVQILIIYSFFQNEKYNTHLKIPWAWNLPQRRSHFPGSSFLVKGQFLPVLFASLLAQPGPTIPRCTTVISE